MDKAISPRALDATDEQRKAAAALMGSIKTPRKAQASRANLEARPPEKLGGRAPVELSSILCKCGTGDVLDGHKWDCPRGQAIKRRIKEGRNIQTGVKLEVVTP